MKAIIIEIDEYKKKIPGYDPSKAHLVHRQSAQLADKAFKTALKESDYNKVVLMCGGGASGKSEYVSSSLADKEVIVFDGTLSTVDGAIVKIRNCKKRKKIVEIHAIITNNINKSFSAMLVRERKVPVDAFVKTHIGCRRTILEVLKRGLDADVKIFESYLEEDELKIKESLFESKQKSIEYMIEKQLSEDEMKKLMQP